MSGKRQGCKAWGRVGSRRGIRQAMLLVLVSLVVGARGPADDYHFVRQLGAYGFLDGQFDLPRGIAVAPSGHVYVTDESLNRLQFFADDGTFLGKWGMAGTRDGEFQMPWSVAVGPSGNVFVVELYSRRVQKFTPDGTFLGKWGSGGSGDGQFNGPVGVATDPSGNVYVAEHHGNRIQKFADDGTFLGKWGSYGSGDGQFRFPSGLTVDSAGTVYVADTGNGRIQKFTGDGTFLGQWSTRGAAGGVAVNRWGTVYVLWGDDPVVQAYTADGTFVGGFGAVGTGEGLLQSPQGIAVDAAGNVYVTDSNWAWPGVCSVQEFGPHRRLEWIGSAGYEGGGVQPETGEPGATSFTFRVLYTDPSGGAPQAANLIVRRRVGRVWEEEKRRALIRRSGSVATGAAYSCKTELPNETLMYRFGFTAADGSTPGGEPTNWTPGPRIIGPPKLFWAGSQGYAGDGVSPDTGVPGTGFRFRVLYQDSQGDAPSVHRLVIRRGGAQLTGKDMVALPGGDHTQGRIYSTSVALERGRTLEYRFEFADDDGPATGEPATWHAGPTLLGWTGAMVSGLAALPTNVGTQVTFALGSAGQVTGEVLNVAGRPVRTLCADRACEAGTNTLLWNALSDQGLRVPGGTYLIRVTARSWDGRESTGLATVSLR